MFVYKYLKKKYLLEFKEKGSIHINTLHNLWTTHESIRDEFEGRIKLKVTAKDKPLIYSGEEFHQLHPQIKSNRPNIVIQQEPGATIVDNKTVSNAYVFSASLKLEDGLFKKFGYDAYYKITDPDGFANALFERINEVKMIRCYKARKVEYSDKEITITDKDESLSRNFNDFWNICFTKPKKFRNEKEYRIVYVPEFSGKIEPLVLNCPELRNYCEL